MVYQLRAYNSIAELLQSITSEIDRTRNELSRFIQASGDFQKKAERTKRLQQTFLSNPSAPRTTSSGVRIGELDVVVDASVEDEFLAIELMVRTSNERLAALQKIRDTLKQMESKGRSDVLNEISCLVIESDGIPRKILFGEKASFNSSSIVTLLRANSPYVAQGKAVPLAEKSKLGEVQRESATIMNQADKSDSPTSGDSDISDPNAPGILSNIFRFLTAKPVQN